MNKIFYLSLSLFILLSSAVYAQDFLGKVTVTELAEPRNTSFPNAKAVVLNEEIQVEFEYDYEYGFRVNETVSRKIKLYDNSAKEQLSFSIPYAPKGYSKEDLTITVSNIYRLIGGKVVKEKSAKETLSDIDKGNWREKGVSYDSAKAGDIIEYTYTKTTSYIDELPEWYIQNDLPKESATYTVFFPEYFSYSIVQKGDVKLKEQDFPMRIDLKGLNRTFVSSGVNAIQKVFTAKSVPAYEVEPFLNNPSNYISSVRFDLQQVQFPGNSAEKVMQTEKEFYTDLIKNRGFGKELKQDRFLKNELNVENYKDLTTEQKVNKILSIVQSRVKWNNEYSLFAQNGIKPTYYKGVGNNADINLLLTAMLRYVGVKANPVLISTRSNGVKTVWQRNFYNHIIVAVEVNNLVYLVDAINPHTALNILTPEDLNGKGTIIYDNAQIAEVDLMPRFVSSLNKKFLMTLNANGTISGQVIENYNNYEALNFRTVYDGSEWRLGKWFESQHFGLAVNDIKVYDSKDNTKDVRVVYSFSKNNGTIVFNNKLFVSPFQFYPLLENPFSNEKRSNPIYIGYPELDNYQVAINIPDGYQVTELPKGISMKIEDSGLELQTKFEQKENQIICTLVFVKAKGCIDTKDYDSVRNVYVQLLEQLKTQVTLEKK
ncbi:DUF3857 domain-containing protein [Myroides sp. M-43]|uniref:DUF3857 domain-containing protein n=1 Tax=Myroides oncorhynchi TaxID=2893756 RepID=UPI001E2EBDC3|nr:DUF3857 domain-containing protein [Myroides oncorhynchi]MCC9042789.1 DUF3857 domain-containing protein [Myroides oncorhynchi]